MADVHKRIVAARFYRKTTIKDFADRVGPIMGDVNYCHPFREGNGRAQLIFLQQLAKRARHSLNLRHIDHSAWIEASKAAHDANYHLMATAIYSALIKSRPPLQNKNTGRDPT